MLLTSIHAVASIELSRLFSDNMVLQRDKEISIWGTADTEKAVTVEFLGQHVTAPVNDGKWTAILQPMPANTNPSQMVVKGDNAIVIKGILVGDVWLASGQSNMAFTLNRFSKVSDSTAEDMKNADFPGIHFTYVPLRSYIGEQYRPDIGGWKALAPETANGISAVAFYFAREIHQTQHVPVGIITCAWAGRPIEGWIPSDVLLSDPDTAPIVESYRNTVNSFTQDYNELYDAYEKALAYANERKRNGEKIAWKDMPQPPLGPKSCYRPSGHYEAMLKPLIPFGVKGIIWYQGESNYLSPKREEGPYVYRKLQAQMVRQWRKDWGDDSLPFIFVQMPAWDGAPLKHIGDYPEEYQAIAELRDSQLYSFRNIKNCGMAITIDVGDPGDIHPAEKKPVGTRLALWARKLAYQEDLPVVSGPVYRDMENRGNKIAVSFDYTGSGLKASDSGLSDFLICGSDQKFVEAHAEIENNQVIVWSEAIEEPTAVRYGWKNSFTPSLANQEGLPASPFRTDHFPLLSQQQGE